MPHQPNQPYMFPQAEAPTWPTADQDTMQLPAPTVAGGERPNSATESEPQNTSGTLSPQEATSTTGPTAAEQEQATTQAATAAARQKVDEATQDPGTTQPAHSATQAHGTSATHSTAPESRPTAAVVKKIAGIPLVNDKGENVGISPEQVDTLRQLMRDHTTAFDEYERSGYLGDPTAITAINETGEAMLGFMKQVGISEKMTTPLMNLYLTRPDAQKSPTTPVQPTPTQQPLRPEIRLRPSPTVKVVVTGEDGKSKLVEMTEKQFARLTELAQNVAQGSSVDSFKQYAMSTGLTEYEAGGWIDRALRSKSQPNQQTPPQNPQNQTPPRGNPNSQQASANVPPHSHANPQSQHAGQQPRQPGSHGYGPAQPDFNLRTPDGRILREPYSTQLNNVITRAISEEGKAAKGEPNYAQATMDAATQMARSLGVSGESYNAFLGFTRENYKKHADRDKASADLKILFAGRANDAIRAGYDPYNFNLETAQTAEIQRLATLWGISSHELTRLGRSANVRARENVLVEDISRLLAQNANPYQVIGRRASEIGALLDDTIGNGKLARQLNDTETARVMDNTANELLKLLFTADAARPKFSTRMWRYASLLGYYGKNSPYNDNPWRFYRKNSAYEWKKVRNPDGPTAKDKIWRPQGRKRGR